jgi:hypothetical protein
LEYSFPFQQALLDMLLSERPIVLVFERVKQMYQMFIRIKVISVRGLKYRIQVRHLNPPVHILKFFKFRGVPIVPITLHAFELVVRFPVGL